MYRSSHKTFGWPLAMVLGIALSITAWSASPEAASKPFTPQDRGYWAFQPVRRPAVPEVKNRAWARNAIDAFILQRQEAENIEPGPEADKITLLRRVCFDLTGLPPTPEEVQAFVSDTSPNVYERVVDRLLASPHYGERWGRHWLDVARYAESDGFRADEPRQNVWRYRDYVVRAFNEDKGYDRFMKEQIAGDELWPSDPQARTATAFSRHYPEEWNARDLEQRRQESLQDITDAVGSAFLGLTVGCAKCHDHKFDPILQKDYYRLQAFFAHTTNDDRIPMWTPERIAEEKQKSAEWEAATAETRKEIEALMEEGRQEVIRGEYFKFPDSVKAAAEKPDSERTPFEKQIAHRAEIITQPSDFLALLRLKPEKKRRLDALQKQLATFDNLYHAQPPTTSGMHDLGAQAPPTHILAVSNYARPLDEVEPGFLSILDPAPAKVTPLQELNSTGRRAVLANWLADAKNPLTPRVMVNRIWHYHFGTGIVPTPGDFGRMGQRRTHPQLLDWLADEFVQHGWSMKHMHRLLVTSSTYRQSSASREAAKEADPSNKLLWRFPTQRLEAEAIRDEALAVSGLLNSEVGGPSVYPSLPAGMPPAAGGWKVSPLAEQHRRSLYISVRRTASEPMMNAFDVPDSHESCARRANTTTAPQALTMLNSEHSLAWAQAFAGRVIERAGTDPSAQVNEAYRLAYSRPPEGAEKDRVLTFLNSQKKVIAERLAKGEPVARPAPDSDKLEAPAASALVDLCLALLNSNEFVYRF